MLDALPLGYPLPLTYPETLVKYYAYLDGEYDLTVYNKRYEFLDGEYDLNAYLKQYTHLSGEYDLNAYTKKYSYLDGEYALLAYAKTYQYLDGEYDLNAYTKKYQYLDGEYALLAYEVFKAFVANLATGAHSTYSNFDFNSLSGSYGAKSDGIYRLTGTTDNGAVINTLFDIGKTDFQSSFLKRINDAYLGLASDGNVKMTVATENSSTEYVITADSDLMTHKINLGRGALGRYWQVKLENQSGSSFVLEDIELYAEILSRRAMGNTVQATVSNPVPDSSNFTVIVTDIIVDIRRAVIATATGLAYADKDTAVHANSTIGFTRNSGVVGERVYIVDDDTLDGFVGLTAGQAVYLGNTGQITQTAQTTGFSQQLGIAISTTAIQVKIMPAIILV